MLGVYHIGKGQRVSHLHQNCTSCCLTIPSRSALRQLLMNSWAALKGAMAKKLLWMGVMQHNHSNMAIGPDSIRTQTYWVCLPLTALSVSCSSKYSERFIPVVNARVAALQGFCKSEYKVTGKELPAWCHFPSLFKICCTNLWSSQRSVPSTLTWRGMAMSLACIWCCMW